MNNICRFVACVGAALFLQACENSPVGPSSLTSSERADVSTMGALPTPDNPGARPTVADTVPSNERCESCAHPNSWLSDATGINIDIPNGKVEVGKPDPIGTIGRIGQTIVGAPLKQAILSAKHNAGGGQPIPSTMQQRLRQLGVRADLLQRARWNTNWRAVDTVITAEKAAVTLEELIVFRNLDDVYNDILLWVHELKHFEQYDRLGLDAFASEYSVNSWVYENEAIDAANQAAARMPTASQQTPRPGQPTYYSYCSTWAGNGPTIAGGLPAGSPCYILGLYGPIWGTVVGFYR